MSRSTDGGRWRKRKMEIDEEEEARSAARERGMMIPEKELKAIKEQYMGSSVLKKKRVIKPSEKFRFSFDWDYNAEDTSRDVNSLYENPHEANLLFGRGFRGGIDKRWQKKKLADTVQPERPMQHWSLKKLEDMIDRDWKIFHEDFGIVYRVMGRRSKTIETPIHAMRKWEECKLSRRLLHAVERFGYEKPTPIQMATIPLGLEQRDLIGIAETGSGKTAAFVLPMLNYISRMPPVTEENGPYALVLAPTRELAQQIEAETRKLAHYLEIKIVSIVGGRSIEEQAFKIRQGCQVVIATPGRLKDCLERQYIVLNQCNYVVLDEADRMIDMGFMPQVEDVLKAMTPSCGPQNKVGPEGLDEKRTTIMFSATMPPAVEKLSRNYLTNPVVVTVGNLGKPSNLITQHVVMINESQKMHKLRQLLDELGDDKTAIVFVNTKITAEHVSKSLCELGYRATSMHGDKSQDQREVSLKKFRAKECNVLVATDVAGRGIDVPGVAHVINYDMPATIDTYVHHIGRTGRADKSGIATTFLTLHDTNVFYDLKQMLEESKSYVPPELARHEASKFKPDSIPDRPPRRNDTVFAH